MRRADRGSSSVTRGGDGINGEPTGERARQVKASYDTLAVAYAAHFCAELEGKPFDRRLLDQITRSIDGAVCDLGCGPGHVTNYLRQRGANVRGIDISPRMIEEARQRYPDVAFEVGDMRSLPHDNAVFDAVVALYSLIHFDDIDLSGALREIRRLLAPDGLFLGAFHRGRSLIHFSELLGYRINLDFRLFEPDEITALLTQTGFAVKQLLERDPYPDLEAQTQRIYMIATPSSRFT